MEDQATIARLPLGARRVIRQSLDVRPGLATVAASEQAGRFDARVDRAVRCGQVPDRGDLRPVLAVGEARGRLSPGRAHVRAAPDRRAVPLAGRAGQQRALIRVPREVAHRPRLAERAANVPVRSVDVTLEDERALLRAEQDGYTGHRASPSITRKTGRRMPTGQLLQVPRGA